MTAAYKKKLEEEKKWLAEEKVREAQEAKNDVVKKGHMGDFYRQVMRFRVGFHNGLQIGAALTPCKCRCVMHQASA